MDTDTDDTTERKREEKPSRVRRFSMLVFFASTLSAASLVWTTYSVMDLMRIGVMGLTIALTADIVWGSILYAEYKRVRLWGKTWPVMVFGWVALGAVIALIVLHGLSLEGRVMMGDVIDQKRAIVIACAGPLLPLGAKLVWLLAIARHEDPTALTPDQEIKLHDVKRQGRFKAAQAEALREKERLEREAELERMAAEREKKSLLNQAAMEDLQAEADRQAESDRREAERKQMSLELQIDLEIQRTRGLTKLEQVRREAADELGLTQGLTQHLALPNPSSPPQPGTGTSAENLRPVPASHRRDSVTVNVTGLTEAQQRKKRLAAAFYVEQQHAADNGMPGPTQASFANRQKVSPVEVTRALKAFPEETLTEQDFDEVRFTA